MKKVSLKKISVQNFRSKTFEFEFGEKNVLSGRNRCGKSTVKNAFLWLLTGYDDEDRANFNLFDTTVEYTHDTAVPAEVSAILVIDGLEYELKRSARMGWTRPRGKEEFERKNSDDYSLSALTVLTAQPQSSRSGWRKTLHLLIWSSVCSIPSTSSTS